jgi:hypothetical protein
VSPHLRFASDWGVVETNFEGPVGLDWTMSVVQSVELLVDITADQSEKGVSGAGPIT